MTQKEALQVLAILRAAYPDRYMKMTQEEAVGVVNTWALQFANIPVDIVLLAVQKLISSSDYPPPISKVKAKLRSIHWEAYGVLRDDLTRNDLPEQQKAYFQRICDATEEGRFSLLNEPTLAELASGQNTKLLE